MAYSHTVVGIFDNDFAAEDLVDVLIKNGFGRKDIDIRNHWDINDSSVSERTNNEQTHLSGLASFFKTIFGSNKEDAETHYNAAAEGCSVVAVYVNSEDGALRASEILDKNGAINVDDRTAQYEDDSEGGTGKAQQGDFHSPILTKHESEFATAQNTGRLTEDDFRELKNRKEVVGAEAEAGDGTRSRINEWRE